MLKKNAIAVQKLAKELMKLKSGDKLDTVKGYSSTLEISVGTISNALKEIEDKGGAAFEKKGHMGTRISRIDYEKLYELTGNSSLICVMPLPYLRRYEGLASAIKVCMGDSLYFAYMRGGDTRVKFLEKGNYQSAILSKLAAEELIREGRDIEIAYEFGPGTYMGKHVIVHRNVPIRRIGVDRNSKDHDVLSGLNFQKNEDCEFVDINYNEIVDSLNAGVIDGAIWNLDNMRERRSQLPFKELNNAVGGADISEAVIVIRKGEGWISNYLKRVLKRKRIQKHQEDVIAGKIYPSY